MAEALRKNTTLQTLKSAAADTRAISPASLYQTGISGRGAKALADMLHANISLRTLGYAAALSRVISHQSSLEQDNNAGAHHVLASKMARNNIELRILK